MPGSTLGSIIYKWHSVLLLKNFKRKTCVSTMKHLSLDKEERKEVVRLKAEIFRLEVLEPLKCYQEVCYDDQCHNNVDEWHPVSSLRLAIKGVNTSTRDLGFKFYSYTE